MLKKIIILKFFYFSLISVSFSDDLYQSLISTYINNKELNSQRQKTKAVDESLIQSYSTLKPSITGKFTQSDTLNESQKDGSGSTIADSNLQSKKKMYNKMRLNAFKSITKDFYKNQINFKLYKIIKNYINYN